MVYGKHLVVSVFGIPPMVIFDGTKTKAGNLKVTKKSYHHKFGQKQMSGVAIDLVKIIANKLNFRLTFLPTSAWNYVNVAAGDIHGSTPEVFFHI